MPDEIRIVRGVPTDEELAAIVGVLLAHAAAPAAPDEPAARRWAHSTRPQRGLGSRGRGAWRASALPARR